MNSAKDVTTSTAMPTVGRRPAGGLLRLVVALEAVVYLTAAALHLGLHLAIGPMLLAVPDVIIPAAIAEMILGLVVAGNLVALLRGARHQWAITLGAHLFTLLGVAFGMVALALRVGPPPSPHWTLHYVMLAGIAVVLALLLSGRHASERS